jgi:hydrogenase maturation protease
MYDHVLQAGRLATTSPHCSDLFLREPSRSDNISPGILVLAFGNSLRGDDGIGPAVLQALANRNDLPQEIVLLEGDAWTMASVLQSTCYHRVILVDAMEMGCPPGTWRRLCLDEHASYLRKARQQADTHQLNLDTMLALLELIGVALPEFIVYGVQPQTLDWSAGLSKGVRKIIPILCEQILKDLKRMQFYG